MWEGTGRPLEGEGWGDQKVPPPVNWSPPSRTFFVLTPALIPSLFKTQAFRPSLTFLCSNLSPTTKQFKRSYSQILREKAKNSQSARPNRILKVYTKLEKSKELAPDQEYNDYFDILIVRKYHLRQETLLRGTCTEFSVFEDMPKKCCDLRKGAVNKVKRGNEKNGYLQILEKNILIRYMDGKFIPPGQSFEYSLAKSM